MSEILELAKDKSGVERNINRAYMLLDPSLSTTQVIIPIDSYPSGNVVSRIDLQAYVDGMKDFCIEKYGMSLVLQNGTYIWV